MKRFSASVFAGITVHILASPRLMAEPPGSAVDSAQPVQVSATATPAAEPPFVLPSCAAVPAATEFGWGSPTCKICVSEPKHSTKTVYACTCEEYCLPRCSFLSLLFGKCDCDEGRCGAVRVRHRLVVKKVQGCDTKQCILRKVPLDCLPHGAGGSGQ